MSSRKEKKEMLGLWLDLALVVFWFGQLGAFVLTDYRPSDLVIGAALFVTGLSSIGSILRSINND